MTDNIIKPVFSPRVITTDGTDELYKHSVFLRKMAWFVEIIVVTIGLSIAVSLVADGDNIVSSIILSAPFVMVSIVELTKIPFVVGLWYSRKSFILYFIMICFLSIITFETLLNGFERAFTSINSQIKLGETEISRIENQIKINQDIIESTFKDFNDKTDTLTSNKNTVEKQYLTQYGNAVKRNQRLSSNVPYLSNSLANATKALNQLQVEKSELLQEFAVKKEQRLQSSLESMQSTTATVQTERNRLLRQIATLTRDRKQALADANFFTSDGVKKDFDEKIRYTENQLSDINERTISGESTQPNLESANFLDSYYAELLALKDDMIEQGSLQVKSLSQRYEQAVNASSQNLAKTQRQLSKDKQLSLLNIEDKLDKLDIEFSKENTHVTDLEMENSTLRYNIRIIEIDTNTVALTNQIYRTASYIDNVNHYKDIKNETLTLVGLIWFGSLALIGSITGIALTLSGLHLKSLADKNNDKARLPSSRGEADELQVKSA